MENVEILKNDGADEVDKVFGELTTAIRSEKPGDRSERDRCFAILATELQKVHAFYLIYCKPKY
jgi:hypothetical protein